MMMMKTRGKKREREYAETCFQASAEGAVLLLEMRGIRVVLRLRTRLLLRLRLRLENLGLRGRKNLGGLTTELNTKVP